MNESEASNLSPFHIKDCTLAAIATGIKAQTLVELRERVAIVPPSSIYFHFWGGRLRISFEYREYHNDFSYWAHHSLHDNVLAERLELLNPTEYSSMEDLRTNIVEILDNRLDEKEFISWVLADEPFHFIQSKIIIFHTRQVMNQPEEMVNILPLLSKSSLFYHFIDSARRTPNKADDFSTWLQQSEEQFKELIAAMRKIDPYLISLEDLRTKLISLSSKYFLKVKG